MSKMLTVPLIIMLSVAGLFAGQALLSDRLVVTEKVVRMNLPFRSPVFS
jgi:hypothetical protein